MKRGIISFVLVVAFMLPLYGAVGLVSKAAKKTSDTKISILWLENKHYFEVEAKDSLKSTLANAAGPDCQLDLASCQERIANALAEWEAEIEGRASQMGAEADAWLGGIAPGDEEKIRDDALENGIGKRFGLRKDFSERGIVRVNLPSCSPPILSPELTSRLFVYPNGLGTVSISSGAETLKNEYNRCRDGTLETEAAIELAQAAIAAQLLPFTAPTMKPCFGITVADKATPRKYAYVILACEGFSTKTAG